MKPSRYLFYAGVAALGLAAGGLSLAFEGSGSASDSQGQPVTSTITFDFPGEVLTPPPANAAPALTAQAALMTAMNQPASTPIPSYVSSQLGLYTLPAGSAAQCEADNSCGTDTIVNGTAYEDYQVLAYGYEWSTCAGSLADGCANWEFVNANTGADLGGIVPRPTAPVSPSVSAGS